MTEETIESLDLLREIVASFTDHHDAIKIEAKEFPGYVSWLLKVHGTDHNKVVGRKGAHVKALTRLVTALGRANGNVYRFKLLEPTNDQRQEFTPTRTIETYDPSNAISLLRWTIAALIDEDDEQIGIDSHQDPNTLHFQFRLTVPGSGEVLLTATPEPLLDAIQTLWHAWAKKDGKDLEFIISVNP